MIFCVMLAVISLMDIGNLPPQEETVEIRGFLHQMPEGDWVLSTQPNSRSCCSGTSHRKVVVRGTISNPPKYKAVMVRGKLIQKDDYYELIDAIIDFNYKGGYER